MGIGNVTSMNSMSGMQVPASGFTDTKSKSIQNEITEKQQQMQKLSSMEELSVDEKADERKKLQKEISGLNTELERYQDDALRLQKREAMLAQMREGEQPAEEADSADRIKTDESGEERAAGKEANAATVIFKDSDGTVLLKGKGSEDETSGVNANQKQTDNAVDAEEKGAVEAAAEPDEDEDTDAGVSHQEIHTMVSADVSAKQEESQQTVIAEIQGDIAVLKGEISQDERRGVDTDRKQEELEKLQRQEERAREFSVTASQEAQRSEEEMQTGQAAERQFYVSFGN